MKSLKFFFIIVVTVLGLLFLFLIKFNFYDIRKLTNEIFSVNHEFIKLKVSHLEMNLPLDKMHSISKTTPSDQLKYNADFTNNKKLYSEKLNMNMKYIYIYIIEATLNKFKNNLLIERYNIFRKSISDFSNIKESYNSLDDSFRDQINKDLYSSHEAAMLYIRNFNDSFSQEVNTLITIFIFINNISIFMTILIISISIIILARRGNLILNYISSYFNNNDISKVNLPKFIPKFKEEKMIKTIIDDEVTEDIFINKVKTMTNKGYLLSKVLEDLFLSIEKELQIDRVGVSSGRSFKRWNSIRSSYC